MMFWYGGHWAFWQAGLMWFGMILFWALLIWVVYALITTVMRKSSGRDESHGNARQLLDQRLARGEIDEAEYRHLRDLISSADHQESAGSRGAR